jgi:hypothetical protein
VGAYQSIWQALETKARFIVQVMTVDNAARRAEDIGSQEHSYAEVKAIASGKPAVLTLAEVDAELQRLNPLKKNHLDDKYMLAATFATWRPRSAAWMTACRSSARRSRRSRPTRTIRSGSEAVL